jgi:cell fate (sporulation/competence/biofilm development) regulator YlbF (YheA/YmcA/DUF963 family)
MFQHLRFNGVTVEARSDAGRLAVAMLDLNSPQAIQHRTNVVTALDLLKEKIESFEKARERLQLKRRQASISMADYQTALSRIEAQLAGISNSIGMLAGR